MRWVPEAGALTHALEQEEEGMPEQGRLQCSQLAVLLGLHTWQTFGPVRACRITTICSRPSSATASASASGRQ